MPKLSSHELADIEASIASTEADHEAKRMAREEKRLAKERHARNHAREKWVAPILLGLTVLVSWLLWQLQ